MKVTLEEIDLLRKRADVSYEDAKEALEKFEGDMVEALVYLEKENKINHKKKCESKSQFISKVKSIIKKGNRTKFIIKNDESVVLNIPITIVILLTIFTTPFVIIGLIAAILTKHKISIEKPEGGSVEKVNKVFDKMTSTVNDITSECD